MVYEKPAIILQKFHTDAFLDLDVLSNNDPENEWEHRDKDDWGNEGFEFGSNEFNGFISLDGDGVGGWFNG